MSNTGTMARVRNVYTMFNKMFIGIPVNGNLFKNINKSIHARNNATAPICHIAALVHRQSSLLCPAQNMIVRTNNDSSTKFSRS